jgi:hypothetical protein
MKKLIVLIMMLISSVAQSQIIPQLVVVDDWALVGTNTVREGTAQSVSTWQNTTVCISMAVGSTTAHTNGTVFHIQTSPVDTGDEMWMEQASYTMGAGITGTPTILNTTPNSGSTTILVPLLGIGTWGRFDDNGIQYIFMQGSPTVANSELCTLVSHTTGAASSVTILDGLTNTPGASSTVWDWADTYIYELPKQTNRVRVLHDNTYDPDGSTVYTYVALYGIKP